MIAFITLTYAHTYTPADPAPQQNNTFSFSGRRNRDGTSCLFQLSFSHVCRSPRLVFPPLLSRSLLLEINLGGAASKWGICLVVIPISQILFFFFDFFSCLRLSSPTCYSSLIVEFVHRSTELLPSLSFSYVYPCKTGLTAKQYGWGPWMHFSLVIHPYTYIHTWDGTGDVHPLTLHQKHISLAR